MSDLHVANTILQQLGGKRFIVMTGSKNFVGDEHGLTMTLARNKSRANRLRITLTAMDDYNLEFYRYSPSRMKVDHKKMTCEWVPQKRETVKRYNGIFCDQLEEIFRITTGLYTRL